MSKKQREKKRTNERTYSTSLYQWSFEWSNESFTWSISHLATSKFERQMVHKLSHMSEKQLSHFSGQSTSDQCFSIDGFTLVLLQNLFSVVNGIAFISRMNNWNSLSDDGVQDANSYFKIQDKQLHGCFQMIHLHFCRLLLAALCFALRIQKHHQIFI